MTHTKTGRKWTARWGRFGNRGQTKVYDQVEWTEKLQEKLDKGYLLVGSVSFSSLIKSASAPIVLEKHEDVDDVILEKVGQVLRVIGDNHEESTHVHDIYSKYYTDGVIFKSDLELLNTIYRKEKNSVPVF
jgi:hypothetical protein